MAKITSIHYDNGLLCWDVEKPLATKDRYELGDRCVGSIFEALEPEERVELKEGIFYLDEDLELCKHPDPYIIVLGASLEHGKNLHPSAAIQHHAAFANSVAYLVTGASGGYGGPSCREHAVSWALSGTGGKQEQVETNLGILTVQYPDGSLPSAGQWEFEKALKFAEPLCYGELKEIHYRCYKSEHCFDDAPEDIETLKKSLEGNANH